MHDANGHEALAHGAMAHGAMAPGAGAGGGAGEEASGGTGGERGAESTAACGCGCGVTPGGAVGGGRKAVGVDPAIKERNLKRLRRIEGQVRGLQRMVEEDRYCPEILTQISSVHEALRSTGRELMRNHLRHCVTAAVASGPEGAEAAYDELIELMYRHAR